jgi:CheY-like chemotaxis protein
MHNPSPADNPDSFSKGQTPSTARRRRQPLQTHAHPTESTQAEALPGLALHTEFNRGLRAALLNTRTNLQGQMPATLLLIDDNAVQAATRQTILKRAGYFVIAVLSPQRALEQLQSGEYPAPIDLIITDHVMPGMNGSEFVTKLREFAPTVPVLVISGLAEAEDEYENLNAHFRLKPLLPDNLLASVHRLVESKPKGTARL